ncbi:MAG TPA: hypothetical protein DCQ56_01550 [Porphyromonadaceae bacterium]|nr:hypothetical protein [Porphyromonadaceae bacterium]
MTRWAHISVMALVLTMAWSCSKDRDIDPSLTDYRYDVVTYLGSTDNGMRQQFELVGRGDNPSVILEGIVDIPKGVLPNHRVLLRYDLDDRTSQATRRSIKAYGCTAIISDSIRYNALPLARYPRHAVRLRSLWRTGDFVNLHCQVEYTGKSRLFFLMIDSATIDADTVQCYLVHDPRTDSTMWWRECYASFHVGNVWRRPGCRALRVHITDVVAPEVPWHDIVKP